MDNLSSLTTFMEKSKMLKQLVKIYKYGNYADALKNNEWNIEDFKRLFKDCGEISFFIKNKPDQWWTKGQYYKYWIGDDGQFYKGIITLDDGFYDKPWWSDADQSLHDGPPEDERDKKLRLFTSSEKIDDNEFFMTLARTYFVPEDKKYIPAEDDAPDWVHSKFSDELKSFNFD